MFKIGVLVLSVAYLFSGLNITKATKLSELPLIDDASREILFLDIYKRLSVLEARAQMSDTVDWTQQTQFNTFKVLAENQQKWLKDLQALVTQNDRCDRSVQSKKAAFSAYLNQDLDGVFDNITVFSQVLVNEGGFYDPETGLFTCPWDGVYDFSFFVGQRGGKAPGGACTELYVNDENIVMAAADVFHSTQDVQGGNRAIIRLKAGDIVKVVANGDHIEGNQLRTTTFSGMFLFD